MKRLQKGKAALSIARFFAGARLIALNKIKEGCPPDVRPIAVGDTLRRLAGKCVCAILKEKVADFFHPLQYGVACQAGAEKVIHQTWYLDDGVLAGSHPAVLQAVHLMGNTSFPPSMRSSLLSNLDILGVPIDDYLHCTHFISEKSPKLRLLSALVEVAAADLHVATSLLRISGKLVHLARTTPPSLSHDSLKFFDEEQAQLSLSFGGLGFRSLSHHCCAAFISYLAFSVTLNEASIHEGAAALAAETRKHAANDARCQALGWSCIPLAVETFGNWGREAQCVFSRLATLLALR
eukprot:Em0009g1234a